MSGEYVAATNESLDHDPKRTISRLDSTALLQGLERLRECVAGRLNRLEAAARERSAAPVAERTELERKLERRIAEFEEAQLRLRSQADRREQEWRSALEQIEGDRTLLAEAWEQLERERIETMAAAPAREARDAPTVERGPAPPARPRPDAADPANDQVAHAILKQFHALRNDVRLNTRRRGPV